MLYLRSGSGWTHPSEDIYIRRLHVAGAALMLEQIVHADLKLLLLI
jgi:hypothetical protein